MKTNLKFIILSILSILISVSTNAQQGTFSKVYKDLASSNPQLKVTSIVPTYDHNYMIAGNKYVVKTDTAGAVLMCKIIGTSSDFKKIIPTNDSCFLIFGNCVNDSNTRMMVFCVKINSNGDTLWSKAIDLGKSTYFSSAQLTNDNGFIITANVNNPTVPYNAMVVVKLDSLGTIKWSKKINAGNYTSNVLAIQQTVDSAYVLIGEMEDKIGTTVNVYAIIYKLDVNGTLLWAKKYNQNSTSNSTLGNDIKITPTGFICSLKSTNNTGSYLLKTDFDGNILWCKHYYNTFSKISSASNNSYFLIPNEMFLSMGDIIAKVDSLGNAIWSKMYLMYLTDVIENTDKSLMVIGNGPVWGVKSTTILEPQFALMKTDSIGYCNINCKWNNTLLPNVDSLLVTPTTCTISNAGVLINMHPVVTNATLSTTLGCVEATGSVDEFDKEKEFLIYPNPAHKAVTIQSLHDYKDAFVTIYNVNLGLVATHSLNKRSTEIDVSKYSKGLYFVKIQTKENVSILKLIKE